MKNIKKKIVILVVAILAVLTGTLIWYTSSTDIHGCKKGEVWGYSGDPTGMSMSEIEARSECLDLGLDY